MNQWRNFTMAETMIHEVLEKASELKTKTEKKEYLLKNNSKPLRNILKGGFDKSVIFILPKGSPPYRKDDAPKGLEPSNLFRISSRFKYFFKGGLGEQMPAARREKMFIDILESLHPEEAELVIAMKEKKLVGKYKGITKNLVKEIWPTLIADGGTTSEIEEK